MVEHMDIETILSHVRTLAEPLLAARGIELVDLTCRPQGRNHLLQLLVDAPGGISLDRCAEVNRAVSAVLDTAAELTEPYVLEVASPGLDRPLATRRDFERAIGETVTMHLRAPYAGAWEVVGRVVEASDNTVTLETKRWGAIAILISNIAKAVRKLQW